MFFDISISSFFIYLFFLILHMYEERKNVFLVINPCHCCTFRMDKASIICLGAFLLIFKTLHLFTDEYLCVFIWFILNKINKVPMSPLIRMKVIEFNERINTHNTKSESDRSHVFLCFCFLFCILLLLQ